MDSGRMEGEGEVRLLPLCVRTLSTPKGTQLVGRHKGEGSCRFEVGNQKCEKPESLRTMFVQQINREGEELAGKISSNLSLGGHCHELELQTSLGYRVNQYLKSPKVSSWSVV